MSVETNKNTVRRFIEALDSDQLSVVPEVCTPECAQLWGGGINVGPWSDHHIEVTDLIGEGDMVVGIAETRGRVVGDFYGVPGDGEPFHNRGAVAYRFADDKIASIEVYFNDLPLALEALGARLVMSEQG